MALDKADFPALLPYAEALVCAATRSPEWRSNARRKPPKKNRNRFLLLAQLVAVAGGVLIFGGGSYCV